MTMPEGSTTLTQRQALLHRFNVACLTYEDAPTQTNLKLRERFRQEFFRATTGRRKEGRP